VDALNGAPGVHAARFAALESAANSADAQNNAKLLACSTTCHWRNAQRDFASCSR